MTTTTPIRLCAFDMAGTTIDDRGRVYDALRDSVTNRGATVADGDLQTWMGTEKRDAITNLLRLGGVEPTAEVVDQTYADFVDLLRRYYTQTPPVPLPGVAEAFDALRAAGIKVALTTGFSREVAEPLLTALGWEVGQQLDAVVCADEVAAGRPAPYMVHRALERTGVDCMTTVLVAGDTVADVKAGLRSGAAQSIGVLTGQLSREALAGAGATAVLDGVKDIPAHLGL
ncbi:MULTISPECIES: phosphonatase-like hydrolase [unclassified Luteococcus]|uniref:phosphonatase-like hydrolase n=1 Tax=unclassified Luteococcus TaxID=2639923 RepID=UPI00313ED168